MRTPMRSLSTAGLVIGLALLSSPDRADAQDAAALLAPAGSTMQDIENNAMRNAMKRVSSTSDATGTTGLQGNVFTGLQQGNDNRIDATQTGLGNIIHVTQIGDMHNAVITQSGSYNRIILRQGR